MRRLSACLVLIYILLLIQCKSDHNNNNVSGASSPTVTAMTPTTVSRGQSNVVGHIQGTNLGGVLSVNLGDGITVAQVTAISATEVEITFTVSLNAAAGPRAISVTTSAGTSAAASLLTVSDNRAPVAKFTLTPTKGAKNTVFGCDATASTDAGGKITSYRWDFGDGHTANGRLRTHQYTSIGTFEITLTVTDDQGASNQASQSVLVETGIAPLARFFVTPESGDIGTKFGFNASQSSDRDGTIKKFEWVFDDGAKANGQIVEHQFSTAGVFTVKLTVVDNDGLENLQQKDLRVENFNATKAIAEIEQLMTLFFKRFAKLDKLSAESIVEGWSVSAGCFGRDREINIIRRHQQTVQKTTAEILGPVDVTIGSSHVTAHATVRAKFDFVLKDGTKGTGKATHNFSLIFEDGEWHICNFTASAADSPALQFLLAD